MKEDLEQDSLGQCNIVMKAIRKVAEAYYRKGILEVIHRQFEISSDSVSEIIEESQQWIDRYCLADSYAEIAKYEAFLEINKLFESYRKGVLEGSCKVFLSERGLPPPSKFPKMPSVTEPRKTKGKDSTDGCEIWSEIPKVDCDDDVGVSGIAICLKCGSKLMRVVDNNFELFWAEMIVENGGFYADEKRHFPCSK